MRSMSATVVLAFFLLFYSICISCMCFREPEGSGGMKLIIPWNRKTVEELIRHCPLCDNKQHWFSSYSLRSTARRACVLSVLLEVIRYDGFLNEKPKLYCSITGCSNVVVSWNALRSILSRFCRSHIPLCLNYKAFFIQQIITLYLTV